MIPILSVAAADRWCRRVPAVALSLAVAVPLAVLVVSELALDTDPCTPVAPCRFPLSSTAYHAVPVAELLAMAAPVLALLLPRAAVWVAASAAALLAGPASPDSSFPTLWRWALVWFLVLGAVDLLGRWRQLVQSHTWDAPTVPYPDPGPDDSAIASATPHRLARDEDTRGLALVGAALGVAVFGAMLAWHLQATAAVRDFEAHAVRTEAPVTKVDDDDSVTLRVDGRDVELEPTGSYEMGQTVPVLVDAADPGHVVLVAEPDDPSWRLGLGALALAVLLGLAARLWARGASRWALWRRGGPAVRMRVGRRGSHVLMTTLDDPRFRRPVCLVGGLQPSALLLPLDRVAAHTAAYPFVDEDEWDDAPDALLRSEPPDVATLSDSELAAWADQEVEALGALDDDDVPPPPDVPRAVDGGVAATVVGLRRDGDPLLVLLDDGQSLVSTGGSRDPWTWRTVRDHLVGVRLRERAAGAQRSAPQPAASRAERPPTGRRVWLARLVAVVSPIGPLVAYAVAVAAYPAARWLFAGEAGWGDLFPIVFGGSTLAEGLIFLDGINRPPLASREGALLHRGRWFDELLPVERVQAVTPGRSSVVLRLTEPDDALALPPQAVVRYADHLAAPDTTPEQAAFAVEQLLRLTSPTGRRGWRRPSAAVVPGALLMLGLLAAWVQAKFG